MPEGVYGPELEGAPSWQRPGTSVQDLANFTRIRDRFLMPVLAALQLRKTHALMSVDQEDPSKPVQVSWDLHLAETLAWSELYGHVGPGMIVTRTGPKGEEPRKVAMVQIAGVVLDEQQFAGTPRKWYKEQRSSRLTKDVFVLTLHEWFLTSWGLWLLGQAPEPGTENVVWHRVSQEVFGRALDRMFENAA